MPMNPELDTHPAIISIRRDGFLSDAIASAVPSLREMNRPWFDFSTRANGVGQRIMNAAEVACIGHSTHDPICVATRLLIRSLSGFQAVVVLAERGMTLEADTLIRGLYENSLWLGYLHTAPAAAVEALRTDELHSQRGRDRAVLGQLDRTDAPDLVLKARLMERVAEVEQTLRGRRKLGIEALAAEGQSDDFYAFYKMLSSGSAHPSFHSLSRHVEMNPDGTWSGHVTGPDGDGIKRTLTLGTQALLACLAAFNVTWPHAEGAGEVQQLLEEHLVLAGVGLGANPQSETTA
ncbi:hypothetical protein GCM10009422_22360 [Brevundimonas kwangchunensis]|uniref:Uncharacterized protein n=1 Tax=Brevundimonas kwangchunensis TaxID=322163 RepID=A0ABN1H0C5_9CAUL